MHTLTVTLKERERERETKRHVEGLILAKAYDVVCRLWKLE